MTKQLIKKAVLGAAMLAALGGATLLMAGEAVDGQIISDVALRSDRVALLGGAKRGERMLAVGERGVVFISENGGVDWKGVRVKASTVTLTAVASMSDTVWLATGHGGVIMRSVDGGNSAQLVENDAGRESLLGLTAVDDKTVFAYGAFGTLLRSTDAGASWARLTVIDEAFDRHIYGMVRLKEGLLLAGESGTLARSVDGGTTWKRLASPYEGSFFGGLQTGSGAILLFGMRGSIYRSADNGVTWTRIEVGVTQPFFGFAVMPDGRIVLSGGRGHLAVSKDDGLSFEIHREGAKDIGGLLVRSDAELVGIGAMGLRTLPLPGL